MQAAINASRDQSIGGSQKYKAIKLEIKCKGILSVIWERENNKR